MKEKILCQRCGQPIPEMRLKFLPDTNTCVNCSQTRPYSRDEVLGPESQYDYAINPEDFETEYSNDDSLHAYND